MFLDLALAFDPVRRRCDLLYAGGGLAIDTTPITPVLLSLGADRRAEPDDALPDTVTEGSLSAGLNPRRGCPADAFDPNGERGGSRLWLLEREKQTDDVLLRAGSYARQALAWIEAREGVEIDVAASWPTRTAMRMDVQVGSVALALQVPR